MKNSLKKLSRENLKQVQGAAENVRFCCLSYCEKPGCASWVTNMNLCPFEPGECI
ncbi:bacteriocin-like protein [Chryseobacterium polytrichastri]|uniref:Uncharacterized protein n=1 Tax=Chryseobacterium polytrichastri TaxID=1302687 RepID=A0A1M7A2N3_9FLAO|nr:hypothetical protein SAMN05444267_1016104 [Chryseobacterium polytrichastri]